MLIRSIKKYHHQTIGYLWGKEALILCPCLQRISLFVCNLQIEPKVTEIKSTAVLPYIKDYHRVISVRSHVSLGCCFKFVWVRHWRKCIELWKWDRTRQKGRKITSPSRKKLKSISWWLLAVCSYRDVHLIKNGKRINTCPRDRYYRVDREPWAQRS